MNHRCARMISLPSVFKSKYHHISNCSKASAICPAHWTCSEALFKLWFQLVNLSFLQLLQDSRLPSFLLCYLEIQWKVNATLRSYWLLLLTISYLATSFANSQTQKPLKITFPSKTVLSNQDWGVHKKAKTGKPVTAVSNMTSGKVW